MTTNVRLITDATKSYPAATKKEYNTVNAGCLDKKNTLHVFLYVSQNSKQIHIKIAVNV